jgi:N-acyl amino acid synthase of PEP-CTERM/exosortase system
MNLAVTEPTTTDKAGARRPHAHYFSARTIDGQRALLDESYRLRYQVYCVERKFLRPEDYPDGMEMDEFDRHAAHVGAIDSHGALAGTARVVRSSELGLPIFDHCAIFPNETEFTPSNPRLVEVGRLSVSRSYRRRRSDDAVLAGEASARGADREFQGADRRGQHDDVFLTVLKGMYQAAKRAGASHWLAATEKPLQRMLAKRGFPFHQIGPDSDYFGIVAAYQMDLQEFEEVILSGHFPALEDFLVGFEPDSGAAEAGDERFVHAGDAAALSPEARVGAL